jgi:hypothetical protein
MTGTNDSSTTDAMSPAPPRGMSTSTSPRRRMSSLTDSCVVPGTSWMASAGMPASSAAWLSTSTSTEFDW